MTNKIPITLKGKRALETELEQLKSTDRPAVIQMIAEARAQGDLSENAEYSAAREKQGFIEGRIQEIGDRLARAEVIDPTKISSSKVVFGATVKIVDEDGVKKDYQIVGQPEADLENGKISVLSPVAKALLGKEVGDEAIVKSPKGEIVYEILELQYI